MSEVSTTIRDFILIRYLPGESPENLRDDIPLRTSGILDSLATLSLISFIEEQFHIEVEAHETDIDNFDRLRDIVAFVERKRASAGSLAPHSGRRRETGPLSASHSRSSRETTSPASAGLLHAVRVRDISLLRSRPRTPRLAPASHRSLTPR